MWQKSWKNVKMYCKKKFQSHILYFFLLKLSESSPLEGSYSKKEKIYCAYFLNKVKRVFYLKIAWVQYNFKTKKSFEIFLLFFFTMYSARWGNLLFKECPAPQSQANTQRLAIGAILDPPQFSLDTTFKAKFPKKSLSNINF
jgi:hypothetical protein